MHATGVFPPFGRPMSDGLFVWATLYRVVFTIMGAYVTARLAPTAPMQHAIVLGSIGTLAAIAGAVATWNQGPEFGPKWYPILIVLTGLPCSWAGARIWIARRALRPVGSATILGPS